MNQGKTYYSIYTNPYILKDLSKSDINFTQKTKKQYYKCKKFENNKIFQKMGKCSALNKITNALHDRYKKKINFNFLKQYYEKNVFCEDRKNYEGLYLKKIFVYDLLPKEDLENYENGILKFKNICKKDTVPFDISTVEENFNKMKNNAFGEAFYNIGHFNILNENSLYKWVDSLQIVLSEFENYFIVIYQLNINKSTNNEIQEILNSSVSIPPVFKKDNGLISLLGGEFSQTIKTAIKNLVLEIKYKFITEMKKYVPVFFHNHELISPSLEVYESDCIKDSLLRDVWGVNLKDIDFCKKEKVVCDISLYNEMHRKNRYLMLYDKTQIADLTFLNDAFNSYPVQLAEFFILSEFRHHIKANILKHQRNSNKLLHKKVSASKLMEFKLKTLKDIFIYKRFVDSVIKHENLLLKKDYFKDFENRAPSQFGINNNSACYLWQEDLLSSYKFYKKQIEDLFILFDDNLKIVESSSNMKLIKHTLIITIVSFVISTGISIITLLLTNQEAVQKIIDCLK